MFNKKESINERLQKKACQIEKNLAGNNLLDPEAFIAFATAKLIEQIAEDPAILNVIMNDIELADTIKLMDSFSPHKCLKETDLALAYIAGYARATYQEQVKGNWLKDNNRKDK